MAPIVVYIHNFGMGLKDCYLLVYIFLKFSGKPFPINYMAQYGAMFIIEMAFASRGRERMDFYTKDDFQILMDEDNNLRYWKLIRGGETKNHKTTDQDMEKGGRIYFKQNSAGLNPGEYLQDVLCE